MINNITVYFTDYTLLREDFNLTRDRCYPDNPGLGAE